MKIRLEHILILLVLISYQSIGQTTNEGKNLLNQEQLWLKKQDSLRAEFNKQPRIIKLSFERNWNPEPFIGKFFIILDSNEIEIIPNEQGDYLVPILIDSSETVSLKWVSSNEEISQQLHSPTEIKFGATITFGIVDKIQKSPKFWIINSRKSESRLTKEEQMYRSLFTEKQLLKLVKKKIIYKIEYVDVTPRTFDGCFGGVNYFIFTRIK